MREAGLADLLPSLAELFRVARSTVYRAIACAGQPAETSPPA
jgi:hypothetical protein